MPRTNPRVRGLEGVMSREGCKHLGFEYSEQQRMHGYLVLQNDIVWDFAITLNSI